MSANHEPYQSSYTAWKVAKYGPEKTPYLSRKSPYLVTILEAAITRL